MVDKELLRKIDSMAYQNRPLPSYFNRNDKTVYRMYHSFMRMLYMLHRTGALDREQLRKEKAKYLKETEVLFVLCESAFKTIRERQGLQPYGSETREGAADIGTE